MRVSGIEYDPSDLLEQELSELHQAIRDRDEVNVMTQVLRTYSGRAVLWRMMEITGLDELSAVSDDAYGTYFRQGRWSIGKWIKDEVFTNAPEAYTMMYAEAVDRERRYANEARLEKGIEDA